MNTFKQWAIGLPNEKTTLIKYLFAVFVTLVTWNGEQVSSFILVGLLELFAIFILSNLSFRLNDYLAQFISSLLILFYNIEQLSFLFAGTYVSPVMLSNIDSIEALSGRMPLYITVTIAIICFSFLPIVPVHLPEKSQILGLFSSLMLVVNFFHLGYVDNSPHYNWYFLFQHHQEQAAIARRIKEKGEEVAKLFYKEVISSGIEKPKELPENPNVILIFTEGLSQSIINDSRKLMPKIQEVQKQSINFDNYYNHTFATYASLSGQLYSGYQFNNLDDNSLPSLQSILMSQGYNSAFINTEPNNSEFTAYLERFRYDDVISKPVQETMSDKEAYDLLWETASDYSKKNDPFFLSIYTFGTHLSLDSPDEQFEDGGDANLNKFYNADVQFGRFFEKFNNSSLAKNTILVFTTDHATYVDDSYLTSFGQNRAVGHLDKVPFFIYYKGVEPQTKDAQGRNSLALAPTVLDYIDVSGENYFLGSSLFTNSEDYFSHVFYSQDVLFKVSNDQITHLEEVEERSLKSRLEDYFAAKMK